MIGDLASNSLLAFLLTATVIEITPGPNMAYLAALSLSQGRRAGIAAVVGIAIGLSVYGVAAALGLGAIIDSSRFLYETLRWAGVAYLTWLGIAAWLAPVEQPGERDAAAAASGEGTPVRLFLRGALVAFSNPKALVFMGALFPQFIDAAAPLAPQLMALVATMVVIEFGWIMAYATGGDRLAAKLTTVSAAKSLNRLTGGLMIGAGGLLALARRI